MRFLHLAMVAGLVVVSSAVAAPPDCTGISGIYNTDSNLEGELIGVPVVGGLNGPLGLAFAPSDNERMFVVEIGGRIQLVKDGVVTEFLDISSLISSGSERGLLSLAFHPHYQLNGYFFVFYTAASPTGALTIARYTRMTPDVADPASAQIVISIPHSIGNHNGGAIAFGPDGHLYLSTGDGGGGCDPGVTPGNAQSLTSNLGKMLRLNINTLPYQTTGNPFDGAIPGNDEIWHYGLRNPWRWSFDRVTGALYIGDVGQNLREEISCSRPDAAPKNYGWNAYEGTLCDSCNEWVEACPIILDDYVRPIHSYSLAGAPCAVIGGYVYRGCRMPALSGTYFYSDACRDFVNTFRTDALCHTGVHLQRENDLEPGAGNAINSIYSFGEDNRGEIYIVDHGGEIYKILPTLSIMEISGPGATPLSMSANGDFDWEDLEELSGQPISSFKVYRAIASDAVNGPGPFTCIQQQSSTSWTGGDVTTPASGQLFYYLVTGENDDGEETVAGVRSDGTLRVVDTGLPCS